MEKILWHRRESRRKTEKTNIFLLPWEVPAYSKRYEGEEEIRNPNAYYHLPLAFNLYPFAYHLSTIRTIQTILTIKTIQIYPMKYTKYQRSEFHRDHHKELNEPNDPNELRKAEKYGTN